MRDYAERLFYANQSVELIERALRQERYLQKVFRRAVNIQNRIIDTTGGGLMPPEYSDAEAEIEDQIYFFVVILRQVVRARELWQQDLRVDMPALRQADLISAWRDVGEHWDDPARGKKLRALERWRALSEHEEPGMSRSGDSPLRDASGLRVKRVRKDLVALRRALSEVSEQEWTICYVTAKEAAEILGLNAEEFEVLAPQIRSHDFGDEGGVRYWREWVEARAEGHLVPPRWVAEGWIEPGWV